MAKAPIHEQYTQQIPLVERVRDAIKGQHHVRSQGENYLPKTSGMKARGSDGNSQYNAYKAKARFPTITQDAENGIIGLAFESLPAIDIPYDVVTRNNRGVVDLSRTQLREVLEAGRSIMVVDAPVTGGDPYIVEYKAEDLINWSVDDEDDSKLTAALFEEKKFKDDDVYKTESVKQYREYLLVDGVATIQIRDKNFDPVDDPITLPLNYLPVFVLGSVDNLPDWDSIPLLPVSDCAFSMYQTSADHKQFLYAYGQDTPWATGVDSDDTENIISSGLGAGSFLFASSPEASFGVLGTGGQGSDEIYINDFDREKKTAEQYTVSISQNGAGVEAAESIKLRAVTRHATIYTILNSVSSGIQEAITCMMQWSGKSGDPVFELNTDFTSIDVPSQLITAINAGVAQQIYPRSVSRNVVRMAGYTELTDDEMDTEILDNPT